MDVQNPKRGDRFLHAQWMDEANEPLPCIVTRRSGGTVYYRAIYADSRRGAGMCTDLADFPRRVKAEG